FGADGHRNALTAAGGRRPAEGRHELRSAIILRPRVGPSIGRVGARVNAHRPWCAVGGAGTWTIAHACHPTDAVLSAPRAPCAPGFTCDHWPSIRISRRHMTLKPRR